VERRFFYLEQTLSRDVGQKTLIAPSRPARLRRLLADRLAVLGVILLAGFILAGVFAPCLAPHDPLAVDLGQRLLPSSTEYPLGTDHLGRCVLSRLIWGRLPGMILAFFYTWMLPPNAIWRFLLP